MKRERVDAGAVNAGAVGVEVGVWEWWGGRRGEVGGESGA